MRKMFSYIVTYKTAAIIAIALMALELAVELMQPLIMGVIINEGIVNQDLTKVAIWASILLGLSALAFIGGIASSFFASKVSQGVGYDLRKDIYEHVQRFSAKQMQKFTASTLITRLTNDVTQFQGLVFGGLRIMLRASLFIIGGIIMAFTVNVKLATILVVSVPFLLVFMVWVMARGVKLFRVVQNKLDRVNSIIRENLLAMRLVKAFYRGNYENDRFEQVNRPLMDVNKKALRLMELTMPIIMLGMNLCIVVILWVGALELNNNGANEGELVSILNYATRIMASFGVFTFLVMNLSRGRASALRMTEVLESEAEEDISHNGAKIDELKGKIEFRQVSFTYPGTDLQVLNQINIRVEHGQTIGILGETGSGKSTLLHLIPRLYHASSGQLLINDQPINKLDQTTLRKQVSMVPQEAHLFTGSIKQNIMWGNEEASLQDIRATAIDAQIDDFVMSLPDQYDTKVGRKGVNLSGGQKQRLSIARALVRNPSILLLDDSTSALDAKTEVRVLEALKKRDCTVIIVAEKISSVINADQILLLHQGNLAASGTHDALLKESATYRQIYQSQMDEGVVFHD